MQPPARDTGEGPRLALCTPGTCASSCASTPGQSAPGLRTRLSCLHTHGQSSPSHFLSLYCAHHMGVGPVDKCPRALGPDTISVPGRTPTPQDKWMPPALLAVQPGQVGPGSRALSSHQVSMMLRELPWAPGLTLPDLAGQKPLLHPVLVSPLPKPWGSR
ncbi:hypothetical protein P7K49_033726 [Saguinus oedipus]|uniref:Uncharacterized protein n=1 Tax=Saguinus oedipus TaxID=9490 RepID=A0ABQ9TT69_SAGOE|nr:hypothetical protein P7K49_033726 [Saguinus oedipus]